MRLEAGLLHWRYARRRVVGQQAPCSPLSGLGPVASAPPQVEFHPYWHEDALVAFCAAHGIVVINYAPLAVPPQVRGRVRDGAWVADGCHARRKCGISGRRLWGPMTDEPYDGGVATHPVTS